MHDVDTHLIYPVILKVPAQNRTLKGREQVAVLRKYARQAIAASAQHSGIDPPDLQTGSNGAPVPSNGVFWSLSHKPGYVAGVVSDMPVGIDVEEVRPVRAALFNKIMDENERQLSKSLSDEWFYRFWTAKETVLKATGVGLAGLSQCKIINIIDGTLMTVSYHQTRWVIEHTGYDNHLISVVKNDKDIRWVLPVSDD